MISCKVNIKVYVQWIYTKSLWNTNRSIILFPFLLDSLQSAVISYSVTEVLVIVV